MRAETGANRCGPVWLPPAGPAPLDFPARPEPMSKLPAAVLALRKQLQELQSQHEAGTLADDAYAQARAALEQRIIEAVVQAPAAAATAPAATAAAPAPMGSRLGLRVGSGLAVAALLAAGYWWTQRTAEPVAIEPQAVRGGATPPPHVLGQDQMIAMTDRVAERLKSRPDDVEGWAMLGRSYMVTGRPELALAAYEHVLKLKPDDAGAMADYADVLAVKQGRSFEGEPMKWIDKALKRDPDQLKALSLAGTAAFNRADYALAVRHWDHAVRVGPPGHPIVLQASSGAAEARQRGKLLAAPAAAASRKP